MDDENKPYTFEDWLHSFRPTSEQEIYAMRDAWNAAEQSAAILAESDDGIIEQAIRSLKAE